MMKILHCISTLGVHLGGPSLSTYLTVRGLRSLQIDANILTFEARKEDKLIGNDKFITIIPQKSLKLERISYSKAYRKFLIKNAKYDILHIQGLWQYPSYIACKIARKKRIPYIITLRGMLYPQVFKKSGLIKKLALYFYHKKDLKNASCIHATCIDEMKYLRQMGIKTPVCVIPNPIDAKKIKIKSNAIRRIGYLGRIHPRKNIERLLYAWSNLKNITTNCELVIVGGGDDKYLSFLKDECARLNLTNVLFTGFLSGKDKENMLNTLSYLALPSDFENLGNVVLEALVRGIPVISSTGTPWEELNSFHCGWWVNNDVNTLTETLKEALLLNEKARLEMGKNGQKLILSNYTVEVISSKMKLVYEWILGKIEKPEFIYE